MIKQPEALRLADTLLAYELSEEYVDATKESAYELRRLHEVNQKLLEEMGEKQTNQSLLDPWDCAAAIRARSEK